MFLSRGDTDIGVAFQTHPRSQATSQVEATSPLSSRVATGISLNPLSGLKGVKPPVEFGQKNRNGSPGHAGKEGPHLAMMGESRGFSRDGAPVWDFSQVFPFVPS